MAEVGRDHREGTKEYLTMALVSLMPEVEIVSVVSFSAAVVPY